MDLMAKRANKSDDPPEPAPDEQPNDEASKRYPSRENVRYLALPVELYEAIGRFAQAHSDEDEKRSISWAGRRLVRKALSDEGFWPPPRPKS